MTDFSESRLAMKNMARIINREAEQVLNMKMVSRFLWGELIILCLVIGLWGYGECQKAELSGADSRNLESRILLDQELTNIFADKKQSMNAQQISQLIAKVMQSNHLRNGKVFQAVSKSNVNLVLISDSEILDWTEEALSLELLKTSEYLIEVYRARRLREHSVPQPQNKPQESRAKSLQSLYALYLARNRESIGEKMKFLNLSIKASDDAIDFDPLGESAHRERLRVHTHLPSSFTDRRKVEEDCEFLVGKLETEGKISCSSILLLQETVESSCEKAALNKYRSLSILTSNLLRECK